MEQVHIPLELNEREKLRSLLRGNGADGLGIRIGRDTSLVGADDGDAAAERELIDAIKSTPTHY